MRCASCGYGPEWHEGDSGRCPLCACGAGPGEHPSVFEPPAPLLADSHKLLAVCPGKGRTAAGKLPTLRRGSFAAAPATEAYRALPELPAQAELAPDDVTMRRAADVGLQAAPIHPDPPYVAFPLAWRPAAVSEPVRPPIVPARYTVSFDEIAPRSMPLGRLASDLGWTVTPWYWQAADGTEASTLVLQRAELRAVAYWQRAPGGTWRTAGAYGWRNGSFPAALAVTKLVELIKGLG